MGKADALNAWSEWQPVAWMPAVSPDVLAETLDGGQSFRWRRITEPAEKDSPSRSSFGPVWQGQWAEAIMRLRLNGNERLEWCAPRAMAAHTETALSRYFGLEIDFAALADTLPWRSDPHLASCIGSFSGLRILRQPFGETLLGFLCSATKQIVQIKQMIALLAQRHGAPIAGVTSSAEHSTVENRLPTWAELARVPEPDLRACLLGFRARYIAQTARFLEANPGWLEETERAPYAIAKERLCTLPGVGEKVADCVLLFGAGRLEAFPVDVWILKTLARRYGLESWKPAQLVQFGRVHFGPLAGLAQQYLFAWERRQARPTSRAG